MCSMRTLWRPCRALRRGLRVSSGAGPRVGAARCGALRRHRVLRVARRDEPRPYRPRAGTGHRPAGRRRPPPARRGGRGRPRSAPRRRPLVGPPGAYRHVGRRPQAREPAELPPRPHRRAARDPAGPDMCGDLLDGLLVCVNRGSTWMIVAPRRLASSTHGSRRDGTRPCFEPSMTMTSALARSCWKCRASATERQPPRALGADRRLRGRGASHDGHGEPGRGDSRQPGELGLDGDLLRRLTSHRPGGVLQKRVGVPQELQRILQPRPAIVGWR